MKKNKEKAKKRRDKMESGTKRETTARCVICGAELDGHGNSPWPVRDEGRCCDGCNMREVVKARLALARKGR